MISALAEAGEALDRADYVDAAVACAEFVLGSLRDRDRRAAAHLEGRAGATSTAYLEDHAFLLEALLTLYEATFDPRWYREAVALADTIIERFADPERGGFFTTAADHAHDFPRRKDLEDSPIPSGSSAAAFGLLRLALLSGEAEYERHALGRAAAAGADRRAPPAGLRPRPARVRLLPGRRARGGDRRRRSRRRSAHRRRAPQLPPPRASWPAARRTACRCSRAAREVDGHAAAYVCERFACQAPVTSAEELAAAL